MAQGFDGRFNVSKTVGWRERKVAWPERATVEAAIAAGDAVQLLTWSRFLGPAETDDHQGIIARIVEAYPDIRNRVEA